MGKDHAANFDTYPSHEIVDNGDRWRFSVRFPVENTPIQRAL
jgi:hypothetical protein